MTKETTPAPAPGSQSQKQLGHGPAAALKQFIEYHAPGVEVLKLDVSDLVSTPNVRREIDKGMVAVNVKDDEGFTALVAALDGKRGATVIEGVETRVQLAAQAGSKAPRAIFRFTLTYPAAGK